MIPTRKGRIVLRVYIPDNPEGRVDVICETYEYCDRLRRLELRTGEEEQAVFINPIGWEVVSG